MRALKILALTISLVVPSAVYAEIVKKSTSGICHDVQSPYFQRTKNYRPYDSLEECLHSGGRLPKGHPGYSPNKRSTSSIPKSSYRQHNQSQIATTGYDRDLFGRWADNDRDCLNTRHELLMKQSTGTVDTGSNHCTVNRGRWNDPYTDRIFYEARDLDIDHLVPLKWAWDHGAEHWPSEKRRRFANDESNLFAVQASVNREKGALGPLQWLPPNQKFHCQYVLRFIRVVKKYGLVFSGSENEAILRLKNRKCAN